jgi:hypothetical protein
MIASRARHAPALLLALSLACVAGGAAAQTDGSDPLLLIPFDDSGAAATGTTGGSGTVLSAPASSDGLEVESLEAVSASAAGTLDVNVGGFSMDMWYRSDPGLVAALLPAIPGGNGSPTATELARRLLLTAATPPEGESADLLALRMDRLNQLGLAADVADLAASAGRSALSGEAMAALAGSQFLASDIEGGCRTVRDGMALGGSLALEMALVFCQRLGGEDAQADLGITLLQESGVELDPQFVALQQAIASGTRGRIESLEGASPLVFAMALVSEVAFTDGLIASAPASVQRAIAESPKLENDVRLAAAELATAAGAMPGSALAELYDALPFTADEIANALSQAGSLDAGSAHALLYRAARAQQLPAGRAEALAALLHHAAETGGAPSYLAAARAVAGQIASLQPASELAWFSADASAALLMAGRPESAARWWPLLQDRAAGSTDFAARATALWPLFRIAFGEQLPDGGAGMAGWWQANVGLPDGRRLALAETYLAAFTAFGDNAGASIVHEVIALSPARENAPAPAALLFAMDRAAAAGSVGQTVLMALVALGPQGPAGADAVTLQAVIAALDAVGLGVEGRLLAMEAGGQRAIAKP